MHDWYYRELSKIYEESVKYIHKTSLNPCGQCFRCCSLEARLGIYLLEYDYIEATFSGISVKAFKDYINKKRVKGDFIYYICPFYKNNCCSIYPVRPMSCRLYPYYSTKKDIFFKGCRLSSKIQLLTVENILTELPFLDRYYLLVNLYHSYFFNRLRIF